MLADFGISVASFSSAIRASIEGNIATQYRVGNKEYDVRVQLDKTYIPFANNVKNIVIKKDEMYIPINELADIQLSEGPTSISRKNKKRFIVVTGNFVNRSGGEVVADIGAQLPALNLQPGYQVHFGGDAEIQAESFTELITALILASLLSYIVLAAILESYIHPFIILMTLPLGLIGVILSLIISGKTINIISLMAMVMLVGIVVNNGILLIDHIKKLYSGGKNLRDAVVEAAAVRFRPILMTNIATIMSMLPLALEFGEGAEFRSPMAIVSIGALITSTIFTLYLIPILYNVFEDINLKKNVS